MCCEHTWKLWGDLALKRRHPIPSAMRVSHFVDTDMCAGAGLALVLRDGKTTWTFALSVAPPPVEDMCDDLCSLRVTCSQLLASRVSKEAGVWWWINDQAVHEVASQLSKRNFCIVDGLCGSDLCNDLLAYIRACDASGMLQTSQVKHGIQNPAARGDQTAWLSSNTEGTLKDFTRRIDTLVAELKRSVPSLHGIGDRSLVHCAKYPGAGARYIRHTDNTCEDGIGIHCNGRRLTAVYYLNAGWSSGDGGELRIWPPVAALEKLGATESQPLADVQPLADRVVLFFSDSRVPHEVLPSYAERFALTVWYYDDIERRAAQQREGGQRQVVRTATGIAGKGGQGTPCAPSAIMINEIR